MSWKDAYPDIPLGRDACGIIAMAEKSGKPSHRVVRRTLESLYRMAPRAGAIRGEGDGTGIQTDIPRELWALFLEQAGLDPGLAHNPRFFVGHFFVPKKEAGRLQEFEDLLRREGQRLGVRPVLFRRGEVVSEVLGPVGRRTEPLFLQVAGLSPDGDAPLWELGLRLEASFPVHVVSLSTHSVVYKVRLKSGEEVEVHNPADLPDPTRIEEILEPYVKLTIFTPEEYVGSLMQLLQEKRGRLVNMNYLPGAQKRVELVYEAPFAEILYDFHDRLKSVSRGYASMDYEQAGYRPGDLVKVNVLVHGEVVDALTFIAHREKAYTMARAIVDKLAEVIPRQLFEVPIQAAIGGKIIARATVKALRKDVLAKCYGGDVTRKKKLLEKQKEGKKRLKAIGKVEVPQEAFLAVLSAGRDEPKG